METFKRIVFCADRPDNGPSGGAAGVMYLLRKYLQTSKCNCKVDYLYRNHGRAVFVKDLIKESNKKDTYFICHEPDSASILGLLGKKYSLIYHQQGPIVQEYINHTKNVKRYKIAKKEFIEKIAFNKADCVFFPSTGAADEYFNSPYAVVKRENVTVGNPMYNTINIEEEVIPIDSIQRERDSVTFLSVGTMSELKGQDQTYEFISKLVKRSEKKIRWITVGDGLLKDKIKNLCDELIKSNSNFEHIQFDKIPHGSVLYLDDIADAYIMLHRSSIFDLATLEAMKNKCAIILSNIGGNIDFNVKNNVIFVNPQNSEMCADIVINADMNQLGIINENVFNTAFSPEIFSDRYVKLINSIICNSGT